MDLLRAEKVSRSFGALKALDNVDFSVMPNEIVGLVGDNGAGKSTLIKIISGVLQPDQGTISIDGKQVEIKNVAAARRLGIETLYQDHTLVEHLSVARNIFLSREIARQVGFIRFPDFGAMDNIAKEVLESSGLSNVSPRSLARSLSGGERQVTALARSKHFMMRLLLLDEPTTHLSVKETQMLFDYIREIARKGVSIVVVSHVLEQIYPLVNRFVVLESGRRILDIQKESTTAEKLADLISGRKQSA
jgi:simple sugar transport system ATP-binding protein